MAAAPNKNIFLTGATGFIGRALVPRLIDAGHEVTCLVRDKTRLPVDIASHPQVTELIGDVTKPSTYSEHIFQGATVLHLAAATGAASESELHSVNVDGTRQIVSVCENADIARFIFISSIAARFDRLRDYPYGQSKRDAEDIVRHSGLQYTILRPTLVFGAESPIEDILMKLATLPIIPMTGGGHNQVQPVSVTDLADSIVAIANNPPEHASTIELGGPEVMTFRELLQRMRTAAKGNSALFLPLPAPPVRLALKILKSVLGESSPVSPGQIAAFTNNAAALSTNGNRTTDEECRTLFRYVFSRPVDDYVLNKYAHLTGVLADELQPSNGSDEHLLRIAQRGPFRAQLADCFARLFVPNGALRRRLTLLVAIAENSPEHYAGMTHGTTRALPLELATMTLAGLRWMLTTLVAVIVLMPGHLVGKR